MTCKDPKLSSELAVVVAEDGHHCSPDCPFLAKWDHPFYHHTAWCWKNMTNLKWYDYWLADCTHRNATPTMEKMRHAGRTKHPNFNQAQ